MNKFMIAVAACALALGGCSSMHDSTMGASGSGGTVGGMSTKTDATRANSTANGMSGSAPAGIGSAAGSGTVTGSGTLK